MEASFFFAKNSLSVFIFIGLSAIISGCTPFQHPAPGADSRSAIHEYGVTPQNVCAGDTVNFNYKLGYTDSRFPRFIGESCPTMLITGLSCNQFYPVFRLSPRQAFPRDLYPSNNYRGSISSEPITAVTPFEVSAAIDTSSPSRLTGTDAFTLLFRNPNNVLDMVSFPTQIPSFTIDPIDPGQEQPRNVVFSPGSCSTVTDASQPGFQPTGFEWSAIDTSIGQARSASVRLSAICNRDVRAAGSGRYDRTVRFLLGFAPGSGIADQISEPIAPNQCLVIPSETAPAIVSSVSVIPNRVESLGSMPVTPCGRTGATPTPPPPITAELKYVCR
jgi:hypothetical protein